MLLSNKGPNTFNGNFEFLDKSRKPEGWDLTFNNTNTYETSVDSSIRRQGKYSVSISSGKKPGSAGAISFKISQKIKGKSIMLVASIKTENVTGGFAGLWLRTEGRNKNTIDFNNMESQAINGTNDWKEYFSI